MLPVGTLQQEALPHLIKYQHMTLIGIHFPGQVVIVIDILSFRDRRIMILVCRAIFIVYLAPHTIGQQRGIAQYPR